jgi:hypothetical protein
MKTPYIGGRVQPKAKSYINEPDLRTRVRELESARVLEAVNQKNAIRRLAEDYEEKLEREVFLRRALVDTYQDKLQMQRWFMGFLCFLVLIGGMILGEALAPYNLR